MRTLVWTKEAVKRLLTDIRWLEREEECEWSDILVPYIDEQLAGRDPASKYPEMHQHLQRCHLCSEEYAELLDLGRREQEGKLIRPTRYYPIDLTSLGFGILDLEAGR